MITKKEMEESPKPKVLIQVPSIYSVEVDPESPQTEEFSKNMIMEKLAQEYPVSENQVFRLEFGLNNFLPKIVEKFTASKKDKHYGANEQLFISRSQGKITEDRLLALSRYVDGFLRTMGFGIPASEIETDVGKIVVNMKAVRSEKINDVLKRYVTIKNKQPSRAVHEPVPIKKIRLDTINLLLEINDGLDFISFKSKRGAEGLERETKAFKVLCHLWELRHEEKNGVATSKGGFATLTNIVKSGGGENENAAAKNIQRLNKRFEEKGWAITIDLKDGKARLTVHFI